MIDEPVAKQPRRGRSLACDEYWLGQEMQDAFASAWFMTFRRGVILESLAALRMTSQAGLEVPHANDR